MPEIIEMIRPLYNIIRRPKLDEPTMFEIIGPILIKFIQRISVVCNETQKEVEKTECDRFLFFLMMNFDLAGFLNKSRLAINEEDREIFYSEIMKILRSDLNEPRKRK